MRNPDRGSLLELTHKICKAMRSPQTDQKMHMVSHAANPLGLSTQAKHRANQIFMKLITPNRVMKGSRFLVEKTR